jgi:hypothetical protein
MPQNVKIHQVDDAKEIRADSQHQSDTEVTQKREATSEAAKGAASFFRENSIRQSSR